MKARLFIALASALVGISLADAPASAAFGIDEFDVTFTDANGAAMLEAGAHPFALTTSFKVHTVPGPNGKQVVEEAVKDATFAQIPGLTGIQTAVPRCATIDFLVNVQSSNATGCPDSSSVGITAITIGQSGESITYWAPVYSLEPPPGSVARLGFSILDVLTTVEVGLGEGPEYRLLAKVKNASQALEVFGAQFTLWGTPAEASHDPLRGKCVHELTGGSKGSCPADISEVPFLTVPRACEGPLETTWEAVSWENETEASGSALTHDEDGNPSGFSGCGELDFGPKLRSAPSTERISAPSGMRVDLEIEDEGLLNPSGRAASDLRDGIIAFPERVTLNPSTAEGLDACSEAELAQEEVDSAPGEGCPSAAKVGSLEVETPSLPGEVLRGSLYVATPFANPAGSLIALYMVIRDQELGILVTQAIEVEPDSETGQVLSEFLDAPQFPLSRVTVRLREGARSPLISPERCGPYATEADLFPWAAPEDPFPASSAFEITKGVSKGRPCPPAGTLPFAPGFAAGSLNNAAAAFTPFFLRFMRRDGDQDLTRFQATFPEGLAAILAGVSECPEAAIAAARAKDGKAEQANPSCPASSEIGSVQAGAGVGSQLLYVPGKVYLAGPTKGAPLSVVGIVPAVAGPFDVGNVVVRQALQVNPRSGQVTVDDSASDPIPHILAGIPLKVRDIQVHVDRPGFTFNPTSCDTDEVNAQLWGGGLDVFSSKDDRPIDKEARFQAADCARLGFKPSLDLRLKGGTRRGDHPALKVTYRARPGDANLRGASLILPRSEFVENANFRTICTRVQYAADNCPKGSIYGKVKAFTPILSEPLEGPVYLRSSDNLLPDAVFALKGRIEAEAVVRIDSVNGRLRATVIDAPDAPVSKVVVQMQGGKKGLFVNSQNLCARKNRAKVKFTAHSGKQRILKPLLRASCSNRG